VEAYLEFLRIQPQRAAKKHYIPLPCAVFWILSLFCKVRGEKVIKGFFNNEPRYLEPILKEIENGETLVSEGDEISSSSIHSWRERYVLLLWLSHLMLAPFPLASMSALQTSQETSDELKIDLPAEVPGITLRVLKICIKGLQSATKERGAAANLLVRLCVRPDMQKLGLLDTLVKWSLSFFANISESVSDIHQCLGVLSFLSGLVDSATNDEIGPFLLAIYQACQSIISQDTLVFVRSSAVARKLVVKTLRNIVIHCLQPTAAPNSLDTTTVLEGVIEFLLDTVADGDSPVRYAASKALSIVTLKLDVDMATDVVEAILGSLSENVYWQGKKRNLGGVDPLRWHGLTLTLSHLLYRKAISTTQLPEILNALLLALAFEQRSSTGGSIGTNVRDAACFGIWALSRRYTTDDLLAVETSTIRAAEHHKTLKVQQVLAIELLVVACLDPAGNIRRGSSAALQELIGRHPNIIEEGIPLVQVVDFHAVGLRERAMCTVASNAASLARIYWEALFENLLGWRGTGSIDTASRSFASNAVGLLSITQPPAVIHRMVDEMCARLETLKPREVEERQGLVLALSALINQVSASESLQHTDSAGLSPGYFTHLWGVLDTTLKLEEKSFTSPALRPEYTASAICKFLGAMANQAVSGGNRVEGKIPIVEIVRLLNLCLGRYEESVLQAIPQSAHSIVELLRLDSVSDGQRLVAGWLEQLESEASHSALRCSGHAIALGAVHSLLSPSSAGSAMRDSEHQMRIMKVLTFRCTSAVSIEARPVALRALDVLLRSYRDHNAKVLLTQEVGDNISTALHIALNDYTVTERGDVGSLIRLEALTTIGTAWESGMLSKSSREEQLHVDVLRLSLEKLDKVRARAVHVLQQGHHEKLESAVVGSVEGVSSYAYFSSALKGLQLSTSSTIKEALFVGFISSAGLGSESVVQNSRAALVDALDSFPISSNTDDDTFSLTDVAKCFVDLLKNNLDSERVLLPLMEVLAFLFDIQVMHRLIPTGFK
jgi:hypothetical protein